VRRSLAETEAFQTRERDPIMPQIIRTLAMNWAIVLVGMMLVAMTTVSFYLIAAANKFPLLAQAPSTIVGWPWL
jgi:hypothetical protein